MPDTQLDLLGSLQRSHMCGTLRASDAGKTVTLMGWVNRRRDLGNLIFIDLRDRTGLVQIVIDKESNPALHEKASRVRSEYVLAIVGNVKRRDAATINKNIPTGEIEIIAQELRVLNDSKTPPFSPSEQAIGNEELRLKYRYIDMRRPEMQSNIELRSKVSLAIRKELSSRGFLEIETPFMTRSTPEGARDYLVPSRVYPGSFYALPQSPQLFKQILMISGFDKYFQIVRCFRDEDLRADRQPEFTQIDLETSFPTQDRVFEVVEAFLVAAFRQAGIELKPPFPRMKYDDAIRKYGIDKPDMRLPEMTDVRAAFTEENFNALGLDPLLPVVAVRIPKVGELSRKERDDNKQLVAAKPGVKVIDDLKRLEKSFPDAVTKLRATAESEADDLLVIVAGAPSEEKSEIGRRKAAEAIYTSAGAIRLAFAQKYKEKHAAFNKTGSANDYRFLWVTDFPMFEYDDKDGRWNAAHHPFTSPHEEDFGKLLSDPGGVRALAYDIVLNGTELGSGSIRIHRQDIQKQIFNALGMTDEEARSRFGFFLEALEYGTPPHGGIALGLDRIVMILAGADSLREVIPFPKTAKAVDLMVDAPTPVSPQQLKDLGISVRA
ncbi:MAG TPA: aspartate--tRNA ligase [Blastocatellia bacterium]|nr:aspartate--tRNA ligase [Blastocatellia bacterium]